MRLRLQLNTIYICLRTAVILPSTQLCLPHSTPTPLLPYPYPYPCPHMSSTPAPNPSPTLTLTCLISLPLPLTSDFADAQIAVILPEHTCRQPPLHIAQQLGLTFGS